MNLAQLERIKQMIANVRAEIVTDPAGSHEIGTALDNLRTEVLTDMKDIVWERYLKELNKR